MKPKSQKILVQRAFLAVITTAIASFIFLSSCERTDQDQAEALPSEYVQPPSSAVAIRDSIIEDLLVSFDAIDANLDMIREKEAKLREYGPGEEILGNREDRIVRDIKVINTLMAENRNEISSLRDRLRKSGVSIASLETRLNHMELENQQKGAELDQLKASLEAAETSLAGLNDTLSRRDFRIAMQEEVITTQSSVIRQQDCKIHEAYVATGSFKELKERGLVDKKGALLGVIGGEKTFTGATDPEEFVTIDQREQVRIPIYAKKPALITTHPEGSYTFEKGNDGKVEALDILDPEEFWQASRYLIVATE